MPESAFASVAHDTPQIAAPLPVAPPVAPLIAPPVAVPATDPIAAVPPPVALVAPSAPAPRDFDRWSHAQTARLTGGISGIALKLAFEDWFGHLARNPAGQAALMRNAVQRWQRLGRLALSIGAASARDADAANDASATPPDSRFAAPEWQQWPFNLMNAAFREQEAWWLDATTGVRGVQPHHEAVVSFAVRQWLDMLSPANFLPTNPEALALTAKTGGANLRQGLRNLMDDAARLKAHGPLPGTEAFRPGETVAITPGKVVLRNRLMELIQYEPAGGAVRPEPILIVPAWIMKFYILDLSPANSLVRYLVGQGHTVFVVSWINPTEADRDLGMDDYLALGVTAAVDAVTAIVPGQRIHATGYCLGGTLLAIAAAAMNRDGDNRFATLTLLAAQTDFTEPGALALFIDDSEVALLEDVMAERGYLDSSQMAGAFQLLNSDKLIWAGIRRDYLMGRRAPMSDLMAWNADGTRLPARMHTEYLRRLFLDNEFARGRYRVDGRLVAVTDIQCPIFCIGTEHDHVAPWLSVRKLDLLTDGEVTFLLTSGGHNVGIVNPPGVPHRSYRMLIRAADGPSLAPDDWLAAAPPQDGSWWPAWNDWLDAHSGAPGAPPAMGNAATGFAPLCAAPGSYVLQP